MKCYRNYIYDILMTSSRLRSFSQLKFLFKFSNVLSSQHKDMQFTVEKATDTSNILDAEVKIIDARYDTCICGENRKTQDYH